MNMNFILSTTTNTAMEKGLQEALFVAEKNIENSVVIVLPETKTVMAERYLLENSKSGAFTNIYICSYNRLLSKLDICNENYLLTREAGIYIVKKLIQELSSDLVCYKKACSFLGFAENIYDTITQLKSSGVTPEEFSDSARNSSGALASKMKDIALLYDAYENYLSDRYLDMSDSLTEIAKVSCDNDFIKKSHIYILGFTSVTHQMDEVILNFVKTARSVTVSASFMHPDLKNAHIADNEVYNHYKSVADRLHIDYNPVFVKEKFSKDIEHIKNLLFAYPIQKTELNGDLKIFAFDTIQEEISAVASDICKEIRNGARYRDFGILLLNPDEYNLEIKRLFMEYNIPSFLSRKYDLSKHCFFLLIYHLLEIARLGFDSQHMIALAKNPLLEIDGSVSDFENYIYRTGVNFNSFLNTFILKNNEESTKEELEAEKVRFSLVSNIVDVTSRLKNITLVKEYIGVIKEFISDYKIDEKLDILQQEQNELGEFEMSSVTGQVLSRTEESFSSLLEFLGESSATIQEFSNLLLTGLSSIEISLIPLVLDSVIIQENTDGMRNIKKLYIIGASEGYFPKIQEDCGIIRDEEINSLSEMFKVKIEPSIRTINRRERYKTFESIISYNNVQISYAKTNEAMEENSPSSMLISIASLFNNFYNAGDVVLPTFDSKHDKLNGKINYLYTKDNLKRYFSSVIGKYKANLLNISSTELSSMYNILKDDSNLDFSYMLGNQTKSTNLTKNDIYFKNKRTSISELEKYFTCPFLHFADYGLNLKDRLEAKMKAVDVGDILHAVAENFVKHLIKGKISDDLHEADKIIHDIINADENLVKNNRVLVNVLEKEAKRLVCAIYEQLKKSEFKPIATEEWFGEKSKYKSIKLSNDVRIEGKIDRIDKCGDYYRVIDYKTGKIDESPENLYYGKKVQLLSYVQALENGNDLKPAGALYFPVRNEWADSKAKAMQQYKNKGYLLKDEEVLKKMDSSLYNSNISDILPVRFIKSKNASKDSNERDFGADGNLLTSKQFENITKYIKELESGAIKEILEGYIEPSPLVINKKSPCAYCDYRFVCGLENKENYEGRKSLSKIDFNNFIEGEE